MSKNRLDISDTTAVSMPMKNLIAIIGAVAVGVWADFGVIERLNKLETNTTLFEKDLQNMMNNAVNIERLQKDMDKALADIEELKDKIRSVKNGHTGE